MVDLSRRGLMASLGGVAVGQGAAGRAVAAHNHPPANSGPGNYTNVKAFGATGDGKTDDTHAIQAAIDAAPEGATVWFPAGTYIVRQTLSLKPNSTYRGSNPYGSIIKQAKAANLPAILADANFLNNIRRPSNGVQIEDLGIDGSVSQNQKGHGIVLMTQRCLVRHVIVSNVPEAGIVLTDRNASGKELFDNAVENRVEDCTIVQPGTYGIWIRDMNSGRQTDGWLLNNVVKDSQGAYAMQIERAAGWFISNNHVYHCAAGGFFLAHVAGLFFHFNEVDNFGVTESPPNSYYGIRVQFLMGSDRPSFFIGNLCSTREGRYPKNLYNYYVLEGDRYGVSTAVVVGNAAHNDRVPEWHGQTRILKPATSAVGSIAFAYNVQPGGRLNASTVANTNVGALTFESVPPQSNVHFDSPASVAATPPTTALAAGVVGGAAAAGVGVAMRHRKAGKPFATLADGQRGPRSEETAACGAAETLSRWEVDPLNIRPEPGVVHLTYFSVNHYIEASEVTFVTGDVPASGVAFNRIGIYELLEMGNLSLIGASGDDAGIFWTAPHSVTTVALHPAFGQVPLLLLPAKTYAYAEIQVGGSPAARVGKVGNPALMALEPRASARYKGYRDLPPELPAPSRANASGLQLYARLTLAEE